MGCLRRGRDARRASVFAANQLSGTGFFGAPSNAAGAVILDDASQQSPTPVASHVVVRNRPASAASEWAPRSRRRVRQTDRLPPATARHSMGGHSVAPNGTVVTMDQDWLEIDTARERYRVAAGARWSTVIAKLNPAGCSPGVMQSNNDFAVASTFCVNAHGWPVPFSGCGSTVRAFTMVLAENR